MRIGHSALEVGTIFKEPSLSLTSQTQPLPNTPAPTLLNSSLKVRRNTVCPYFKVIKVTPLLINEVSNLSLGCTTTGRAHAFPVKGMVIDLSSKVEVGTREGFDKSGQVPFVAFQLSVQLVNIATVVLFTKDLVHPRE